MLKFFSMGLALTGLVACSCGRAEAGYVLTADAAGVQATTVSGATTETFDSFTAGNYKTLKTSVGTLSSPGLQIVPHDSYGGAGGTGSYFSIGAQSGQTSATLTLSGPEAYFGFWWSAADNQNQLYFLSKGQLVASFNPTLALSSLSSAYAANPNNGQDPNEKFAYLNFIGTNGSTFDQVLFSNASTGTGFESDNWSISANQINGPPPGTSINGLSVAVPEPSSIAMTAMGILGLVGFARRRRAS